MATNTSQTSEKYQTSNEMAIQKNGQPQLELLCKKELSNFSMSDNGGTKSKTLSSLGEENGMMQQNRSNEGTSPNIDSNHHEQHHNNVNVLYGLGDHAEESLQMLDKKAGESSNDDNTMPLLNNIREVECNSSAARFAECLAQKSDFSDDLVNAIKRIESRILAFKICSNLVDSSKNGTVRDLSHKVANLGSPKLQRKDSAARSQLSSKRPLWEGHRLMNQHTCDSSSKGENLITANAVEEPFLSRNESSNQSQVAYQNCGLHTNPESAKSIYIPKHISTQTVSVREELRSGTRIQPSVQNTVFVDRVKSLNRLVSGDSQFGNQASECIQGLRVPLSQDNLTKKSSMLGSQTNRESLVRKTPVAGWSKTDPKQKERNSESSHAQKLAKSTPNVARRDKLPPHQMVIKPTLLDQRSSEIKVNSHQHRDGSVLDRRGSHKTGHAEPSKTRVRPQLHEPEESSSNSDSSSQSTSQQDSANTSSQSEDSLSVGTQGSKSGRMVDASYEGNSEESSDSYLNKEDDPSYRVGSFQSYGHRSKGNPKKTVGGLKRLKNKLGLIFHHHHHHHHHHHLDGDNGSTHSYEGPRHSMWNNLQNVFHHKNKHGMITNHKDEKTRRGAITKYSPRRNQVGQFHRLVEGLLRHIRHSKKPKPSKNGWVKGSKNTAHGHRKKKPHWWQILPRRRGVKLKNKGRVKKMGFISQKSLKN
ncbi:basic-leucine zipper transcription factor A [Trifolium pratense]|uniref:basic-leucine zipper transcription factor A n=1 Tax=Trifolium pratense TaxID=57577 RepID=UPI001E692598|nr:basic-leucine zipper transcription factor A [Trifolium pratense]